MKFLLAIFLLVSLTTSAEIKSDSTFLSRLYLPFGVGSSKTDDSKTYSGKVLLSGIEYRIKKTNGLFFRFNFDYRVQHYKITGNSHYNVSEGKLDFTDYLIGFGDRFRKKNFGVFGLIQGGITSYNYLVVSGQENGYKLSELKNETPAFRGTLGLEYYLHSNIAITFESSYTIIPDYSIFWDKRLSIIEFSLGLTTTLF